jgi:ankyrin repeat protein
LISAAIHFKKLNISLKDFFNKKYKSLKPYENVGSETLIQAIKDNDIETVERIIKENRLLVHDFDFFNQTPLHWAAKRNSYLIIPFLINHGENIHSQDVAGRTPLHLSAEKNHFESLKILLMELADPFKKNKEGKMPIDVTNNIHIKYYLSRARLVFI